MTKTADKANPKPWHYNQMIKRHARHIASNIWDHAILDSDDRIVHIAKYERSKTPSHSVVPIPDDQSPRVNWYYNRRTKRFQQERPE